MKSMKMLGLAAVAAMALTAAIGASSASATVLCTTTSTPCGSSWHIDTVEASLQAGSTATLRSTTPSFLVTCSSSNVTATKKATGSLTTTWVGVVTAAGLTWGGCTDITKTLAGGELEVHHIAGSHNGEVTARGFEITVFRMSVTCTYGAGGGLAIGTLTGGHSATMRINSVISKVAGSFLCPSDIVWEGEYTVTNHTKLYVEPS
jgi:hypothetical protein